MSGAVIVRDKVIQVSIIRPRVIFAYVSGYVIPRDEAQ